MPRHTLICTVGTSLFGNLGRLSEKTPDSPPNWRAIRQAFDSGEWNKLARELATLDPTARLCGAEINTIAEIGKKGRLALERIFFLVSDTPDGKNTGKLLQAYCNQRTDLGLRAADYDVIEQLQDERPKDFKQHGLRNLVRLAGECIRKAGGPAHVAIDATGGYKAQIAIAVLLGQVLNIPVSYRHERFSEMIDFPPLPVSFDYAILARNAHLLTDFERGEALSASELGTLDERLRVLLTEVSVNGDSLFELSPIGQIYLTGFRIRNPKPFSLVAAEDRKPPTFRDDHYPLGFKDFVHKVCHENAWVRAANSIPYDRQRSIKGIGFFVRQEGEELRLIGTFQDRNNFGARFRLHITDQSLDALTWAADFLNRSYR